MIYFLEDYSRCLEESIKCYHNEIANYIIENLLEKKYSDIVEMFVSKYRNYYFYPDEINNLISNPNGFYMCKFLPLFKKIFICTIPPSITKIGKRAFDECSSLRQITIPSSVIEIGNNAFY